MELKKRLESMLEKDESRGNRLGIAVAPETLAELSESEGLWYESPEEVDRAVAEAALRARRIRWVRRQMVLLLTDRERSHVVCHYFLGMTIRESAAMHGVSPSVANRNVLRAVGKLRAAAQACKPPRSR